MVEAKVIYMVLKYNEHNHSAGYCSLQECTSNTKKCTCAGADTSQSGFVRNNRNIAGYVRATAYEGRIATKSRS